MMSKYVASWSRQACKGKAESSWGAAPVLLPPKLGPAMAGKGQHQPVRVHHFLLQLDTAPATLPPLTAFDKLFYLHCPQARTFSYKSQLEPRDLFPRISDESLLQSTGG